MGSVGGALVEVRREAKLLLAVWTSVSLVDCSDRYTLLRDVCEQVAFSMFDSLMSCEWK